MGISDRHHFGWLTEALAACERDSGRLASIARRRAAPALCVLAGQRLDPPVSWIVTALGADRARVEFFDRFPNDPTVTALDVNDLGRLADDAYDVVTLFRGSYFIGDAGSFLAGVRRILRPGGIFIADWLHGLSDAPVLDLRGDPRYGGGSTPFITTYADPQMLAEFPEEFSAFIQHVNRPPSWVDTERPGAPVPISTRVARAFGAGPRRHLTLATYLDACRTELGRAGKQLIEPAVMEQYFKVVFRHARYFFPLVKKFNLYLLTVLEPVGKDETWRSE